MTVLKKATQPTMYFIGVTTNQSSIMELFPLWANALNLKNTVLKGIDIDIHSNDEVYQEVVNFIKSDPHSKGALVTTHKIDLFNASQDCFDFLDSHASMLNEISSISKKGNSLEGYAKDPITSGLAIESFVPNNYWENNNEVFIMGAGGSALAISSYLTDKKHGDNIPHKIIISNRSQERLTSAENILNKIDTPTIFEFHICPTQEDNDRILNKLNAGAMVINATGLGKDRPGSPITDRAKFPKDGVIWELNYRGELTFMKQALAQKEILNLQIEDGWIYFIHGWTQVIAEVFQIEIGTHFDELERIAHDFSKSKKNKTTNRKDS